MSKLSQLEPQSVFYYFEKIAGIPHGSRNTGAISDYCVEFAKKHNLRYIQDDSNNVIIFKEASAGYENAEPVVLQGHLDMVCVKDADAVIDMEKDGLDLQIDGDYVCAKGTTLGGDDGIAVAYCLAVLADDTLAHPPIEAVFTTDEEIGLLGAADLDASVLQGRKLINLDSEEEGIFLTSCAGGLTVTCSLPAQYTERTGLVYELKIKGLLGGHSGIEIHKERLNANKLMGRLLYNIGDEMEFSLAALNGGVKDNAIPSSACVTLIIEEGEAEHLESVVTRLEKIVQHEYKSSDPDIKIEIERIGNETKKVLNVKNQECIVFFLMHAPNGVIRWSMDIEGLVQTSLNLGIMELTDECCNLSFAVRSSVETEKIFLAQKLQYLAEFLGGVYEESGDYPGWEFRKESPLRDMMVQTYEDLFGKKPAVEAVHAGLECGVFIGKVPDMDCISLGPDMIHVHSPQEKLSISSTKRMWDFLVAVLRNCR